MPTPRKPWPREAEYLRLEALEESSASGKQLENASELLTEAEVEMIERPMVARIKLVRAAALIAKALAAQERIQRLLIEAKNP